MKYLCFPIAFLLLIVNCQLRPFQGDDFFEGKLTFAVSAEFKNNRGEPDTSTARHFIKTNGDKRVVYLKNGNYRSEGINGSPHSIEYTIFHAGENKVYIKPGDKDTLFWYPTTKNSNDTLFKILKHEKNGVIHNGKRMHILQTEYSRMKPIKYGFDHKRFTETFYYSDDIKISPEWFRNYENKFFYKTFKIMGSFPVYYQMKYIDNTSYLSLIHI